MDVIVLLQLKDVVFNLQVIKVGFETKSCCFNIEDNLALSMLTQTFTQKLQIAYFTSKHHFAKYVNNQKKAIRHLNTYRKRLNAIIDVITITSRIADITTAAIVVMGAKTGQYFFL